MPVNFEAKALGDMFSPDFAAHAAARAGRRVDAKAVMFAPE